MSNVQKSILYLSGNRIMYRKLYFVGIVGYLVMLILSILFYKERIIFLDTSFALFHIARTSTFSLYASRCGALLTQILPVLAVKTGTSLNTVALCYSIGFTLYYFCCYILCGFAIKRYDLGLVLFLFHILFVTDTFYYIPSELPQGVNFLMVGLAALTAAGKSNTVRNSLLYLLLFAAAFFHPLVSVAVLYSMLYFYFQKSALFSMRMMITIVVVYFAGVLINNLFFRIDYDRHAMSGVKNFITLFPDYFTLYSDKQFVSDCLRKYYWLPIGFSAVTLFYIYGKEWKKLLFFAACFLGYLLLVNVSYPTAATPIVYMENQYLPLGLILAYPIVFDIFSAIRSSWLVMAVLLVITGTACTRFYSTYTTYAARLNWERRFLNENGDQKVIVDSKKANSGILQMIWGTPYEFWLLSTIEKGKSASIIIDDKPENRPWATSVNKSLIVNWNMYPYSDLPDRYFNFPDTTSTYSLIK
jgi:hypothetical protein